MPMVGIREVRVRVGQRLVAMPVRVPHSGWRPLFMGVLMMLVVCVLMLVLDEIVRVRMIVLLRQMKVDAQSHERASDQQLYRHRLSKSCDCDDRAEKGCDREVSAGAGRAEMA